MGLARASVMMDVEGLTLAADEIEMLKHPLVGGVILFSRNFASSRQLIELTSAIRESAGKPLLIAVDQEGGRVQRFKEDGFTKLPAMGALSQNQISSEEIESLGWLMASECLAHGIDLSFAPVLDLDRGSDVVGDRAFSSDIMQTIELASYWCQGMKQAGMAAVGKHFPGHGSTKEDTHIASPKDERELEQIMLNDGTVFQQLISNNVLDAVMPAHIQFPKVDSSPVGYSKVWIQQILNEQLMFKGVIFSDDLSMVGAGAELSYVEKAQLATQAGCDMVLICNNKSAVKQVLEGTEVDLAATVSKGLNLCAENITSATTLSELKQSPRWQHASELAKKIINKD